MAEAADLEAALLDADPGTRSVRVDRDGLVALHAELGVAPSFDDLELVVLQAAASAADVDAFALRVGQWEIDMPLRLFQSATAAALLAGAIAVGGESSIPVAVLAVILPFLVDVQRVEPRGRDRIVLARLRALAVDGDDPEDAYRQLPADLRQQITLLEFADVWDRLVAARAIARGPAATQTDIAEVELPLPPVGEAEPAPGAADDEAGDDRSQP